METTHSISDFNNGDSVFETSLPFRAFIYSALGLGTIFYYARFGAPLVTQYYFSGVEVPHLHMAIVSLLIILTLTAIGCSVHVKVLGGFEKSDIQREIKKEVGRLRSISVIANAKIADIESDLFDRHVELTPRGIQAFRTLKKVSAALDKRIQIVTSLVKSDTLPELFRALDILKRKLNTSESATTSLIDVDPIPAIEPGRIDAVIKSLSNEIEIANRLAA